MRIDEERKSQKKNVETIELAMEPQGTVEKFPRAKTARQLLAALNFEEEEALVARDGELLTLDRRIFAGDRITVRAVASRG